MVRRILIEAALAAAAAALLGLGANAARPSGSLPFIARQPYTLVVPCPVQGGQATALAPGDPLVAQADTALVDARSHSDFDSWHLPHARNIPFDYLESVSQAHVAELLSTGAARVVVYGDGQDPDSGHELAKELAGKGVRGVFFVEGGAPALGAGRP